MTIQKYRNESTILLYITAIEPAFMVMDDNGRPHQTDIVEDWFDSKGIAYVLAILPIKCVRDRQIPQWELQQFEITAQKSNEMLLLESHVKKRLLTKQQ